MRKLLLVAAQAYTTYARQRWFLACYFGLPVTIGGLMAIVAIFMVGLMHIDQRPLGLVDLAGVVKDWSAAPAPDAERFALDPLALRPFPGEAEAGAALIRGEIQAYYVVDADYLATGQVTEVTALASLSERTAQISAFLRDQLLLQTDPVYRQRLLSETRRRGPSHRMLGTYDDMLQTPLKLALAWAMLVLLMLITSTTNYFLMTMLSEEQSNRLAELLLSSLSAEQLIIGKVAGMVALGLTPALLWGGLGAPALPLLARALPGLGLDQGVSFPWPFLGLCLVLLLPTYALTALMAAMTGALGGTDGPNYRLMVYITVALPLVFWGTTATIAMAAPQSPASVFLSLLPLTAPVALALRAARVDVPTWQIAGGLGLLYFTLAFSLRYAARLYRATWLMTGQPHKLRSLWLALRGQ